MNLVLQSVTAGPQGGAALFAPLDMTVAPGQIAAVMGASGAGKSTLLNVIAGHLAQGMWSRGSIFLDGVQVSGLAPHRRQIGLMFQDAVLFAHLSVGDNLAFGLSPLVKNQNQRRDMVETALNQAGLPGMMHRDPATLSGGERARAALMRTLLARPKALLLDEPFSKLDTGLRQELRDFTFAHIRASALPALIVTHDPDDASAAAGQVVHLSPQPQ